MVQGFTRARDQEKRTRALTPLAVAAALDRVSGITFQGHSGKSAGICHQGGIDSISIGMPAAGLGVACSRIVTVEACSDG